MFSTTFRTGLVVIPALLFAFFVVAASAASDADARTNIHSKKKLAYLSETHAYDLPGQKDMTAFGDSITTGLPDPVGGFVVRLHDLLERSEGTISWHKFVKAGSPSAFWAAALSSGAFDTYLAESEIVSVETGAVDMIAAHTYHALGKCGGEDGEECYRRAVAQTEANWDAILSKLESVSPDAELYCAVYFDFAADFDPPTAHEVYKRYIDELSQAVRGKCEAVGGTFLDFHEALNGPSGDLDPIAMGYTSYRDPLHPLPSGQQAMAESAQ